MNSKYIFNKVDKLREESLMGMGTLGYKLKNESAQLIKEHEVTKEDLTDIFQEIGNEIKEKITKLADIGRRIKKLEQTTEEKKQQELLILELNMELFQITSELQEDTEDTKSLLTESIDLYERKMGEEVVPTVLSDKRFCDLIENIIRTTNKMIVDLEKVFDESLKNRKRYGGSRAFYLS